MFLRKTWYVAGWASEVQTSLFERRLLDESVLIYRLESGQAVAMGNRCPHRFAPLHLGRRVGDAVQCGYHGLVFGSDGRCTANPQVSGHVPQGTRVKSYPLIERHGLLWIWMDEPSKSTPETIPDIDFVMQADAPSVDGYLHVRADYRLVVDNLMDLSHASFLHENTLGRLTPGLANGALEVRRHGEHIYADIMMKDIELPGTAGRVDQWLDMKWSAPGVLVLDIGHVPAGAPRPVHGRRVIHIVTPETERTAHYYFRNAATSASFQRDPFSEEDEPMLAACQAMMGDADFWSLRPAILPSDAGAVHVRRHLANMIRTEAAT